MEDPQIGGMYRAMLRHWLSTLFHRFWGKGLMRSGMVTALFMAALVVGLGFAYRERGRGNLHKLKARIATERQDAPVPQPGGQEAMTLTRTRLMGDSTPEFLSVTMLPGRGMNVLQITAYLPGRGEVNLMASPSIEDAATAMNGTGRDANGQASLAMGGAFEAPWAGAIRGAAAPAGSRATTVWRGHTFTLPGGANGAATHGLMLSEPADSAGTAALPDGGNAQAVFHVGDWGARWPSKTDVTITVLLSSRSIELTVLASNVGDVAEPMGIGWHPRFAILEGGRELLRLHLPGESRVEVGDRGKGLPTGVLLPVAGTAYDFTMRGGARLGTLALDDCFVALHQNLLDNGPVAELSDPRNNYGLRLTALSPTIKAMHVLAPLNAEYVSIEPQFNYDDPFGREWTRDTGMAVLEPGQTTQWKVRLELYSPANMESPL